MALLGGKIAQVWIDDPVKSVLRIAGDFGLDGEGERPLLEFPEIARGQGIIGSVVQSRTAEYVVDVQDDARWLNTRLVRAHGLHAVAAVPFLTGERVAGALVILFETRRGFSREERELMHLLAGQAAITIENARLFEESDRRRRVAESLAETGRLITQSLDLDELGRRVTDSFRTLLGGHAAALFRREPESENLVAVAVSGDGAVRPSMVLPTGTGVTGLAVRERRPVMIPDLIPDGWNALAPDVREEIEQSPFRAILAVPVTVQNEVIGALSLRGRTGRVFTSEEIGLAQALADQAAVGIENARLYAEATLRREQAENLAHLARVVTASLELPEVLERVTRAATDLLRDSASTIYVADGQRLVLQSECGIRHASGSHRRTERALGEGTVGHAALSREPVVVEDVCADPRVVNAAWLREEGFVSLLSIPLLVRDALVGVLTLFTRHRHRFGSADLDNLTAFGMQAASAIENARLLQESRARQARLEGLMQLTGELAQLQPVETLLGRIAEACGQLLRTDSVGVRLVDKDELVVVHAIGDARQIMSAARLKIGESLSGRVAATGEMLLVQNPADDPRMIPAQRETARDVGHQTTFLGVPIKLGDQVLGVLSIWTRRSEGFSGDDVALATAFAAQAAIALENARLYSETEHRRRVAEQLTEIGQLVAQSLEPAVVGQKIVEGLRALLGAGASALYRVDPVSGDLRAHAMAGEMGVLAVLSAGTGLAGLAVRASEPVVTPNVAADPRVVLPTDRKHTEREFARAALAVPLLVQGTAIGVLAVGDREGRLFSREDVRVAQVFAGQAVLALENARLYEEAHTQLERTQTLLAIGQTVSATLDLTETLRRVAAETRQALNVDMVGAYLADEDERILRPIAGSRVPKDLVQGFRDFPFPLQGHRFVEEAWESRQTVWSEDSEADPRIDREVFARFPHGSVAFVPMIVKDRPIGGLFLVWQTSRPALTSDELMLAEGICRQAAIAVGNAKLYDEVREALEELKRTQEQLTQAQKMDALGRLAGGIAHDFNNLLAVIMGRSDLLRRNLATEDPVRRDLETIHTTAGRAATLTRQLLAFSRKQVFQPRIVDLNSVVASTNEMLRRLIGEDIIVDTVLDPDLGCVTADPGQIEQILMNLVVNARDAMPAGGQLTIETANVEVGAGDVGEHVDAHPGAYVMLALSDTGVGMTRETLAHVFEPFFTTKEVGKGTGLGLATVYGIVKQSAGWVSVDSEPGHGATFKIYLPRVQNAAKPSATTTTSPADAPGGVETILLVEDEEEVRELAHEILRACGYTVLKASNGAEALRLGEHHQGMIHLLLTDMVMPRMSGREVATRLTALRPGLAVLYMSGYPDNVVTDPGWLGPRAAFLQKPMAPDVLARMVRELLDCGQSRVNRESPEPDRPETQVLQVLPSESLGGCVIQEAVAPTSPIPPVISSAARVLVVDDEAEMRVLLEEFLTRGGYQVSTAEDGVAAVRRLIDAPPDIVLLDIEMPGLSGTDALPTIRAIAPRAAVIMVSGIADVDLAKRALAAGAFDYVRKPIDLNYLTQSLQTALTMSAISLH